MPDDKLPIEQQKRDVFEAEQERFEQAGFLALEQLQHELSRCVTLKQYSAWCERVNARAAEILARPN